MTTSRSDALRFGSVAVYRPRPRDGDTEMTKVAQGFVDDLKRPNRDRLTKFSKWLHSRHRRILPGFFGSDVILVPAPGHAPRRSTSPQLRPTTELVRTMAQEGLGEMRPLLVRDTPVPKSAWASPGGRASPRKHYNSMSVASRSFLPFDALARQIMVVDDVITTGGTLYACVRHLMEAYPSVNVVAFAAVRTCSGLAQVEECIDPVADGSITLDDHGQPIRQP